MKKKVKSVLISVYDKTGLEELLNLFKENNTDIYSTGGTWDFLKEKSLNAVKVEDITKFPSMLDGRVKTLHPAVFGGILAKREEDHLRQLKEHGFPQIDMVIVDLYPFEKTVSTTEDKNEIIEKIDIGGISLIRAAAKNYKDVVIVPSRDYYKEITDILKESEMQTTEKERKNFAKSAFSVSMHYDTIIYRYFSQDNFPVITKKIIQKNVLRYGENSHQTGYFYGDLDSIFTKLNGKELSHNNLVDIDAAISLMSDLPQKEPVFAVLKHTNPCGVASGTTLKEAWEKALESDPLSAFGGILISNTPIDITTAAKIDEIFYEVLIAPDFEDGVLHFLSKKKNRIILKMNNFNPEKLTFKSILSGILVQDADSAENATEKYNVVSELKPNDEELQDLLFANIIVKHLKSNAIALVKNKQLIGIGCGQTSRVDATRQSIEKARRLNLKIAGAVLASDAFFPFPDSIELASEAGIKAIIQPGGSVNDSVCIDFCNENRVSMIFTGIRHFRH
jgi:phosphoribosylaminoimidazolecarboxamide formyltransferase / IMP cyclohydrolase